MAASDWVGMALRGNVRVSWFYQAYGLSIKSEFELDELSSCAPFPDNCADLTIGLGQIGEEDWEALTPLHPQVRVGIGRLWLNIPDVAVYSVTDGAEVLVKPYEKAEPSAIKLFLLGTCMGAALWQKGLTVLHGNAIRIGDGVVICVGHSGAGKSTLAAEFVRRGYPVIADDVVAIDDKNQVLPGIPRIKLWQKSLDHFKIDNTNLSRIRQNEDKFSLKFDALENDQPFPLRWIIVLQPDDCATPKIEPIDRAKSVPELFEHSYRSELLSGFGLQKSHFLKCVEIASRTQLARLRRPTSGFQLEELCDEIIDFVGGR